MNWSTRGIELLWLLAVLLVPLDFLDRDYVLSELGIAYVDVPKADWSRLLVGLMPILWTLEYGVFIRFSWPPD